MNLPNVCKYCIKNYKKRKTLNNDSISSIIYIFAATFAYENHCNLKVIIAQTLVHLVDIFTGSFENLFLLSFRHEKHTTNYVIF